MSDERHKGQTAIFAMLYGVPNPTAPAQDGEPAEPAEKPKSRSAQAYLDSLKETDNDVADSDM